MYLRKRELFMLIYWVSRLEESAKESGFISGNKSFEGNKINLVWEAIVNLR